MQNLSNLLILWNVDGTLISNAKPNNGVGSGIFEYVEAVRAVIDLESVMIPDRVDGLTDYGIIQNMLSSIGLTKTEVQHSYLKVLYHLEEMTTRESWLSTSREVTPGANKLLERLDKENVIQSYVTGNSQVRAEAKTNFFGLGKYLDPYIGGFGWWTDDRTNLINYAISSARKSYQVDIKFEDVVIIGDTPTDILAARRAGIKSIGVSSGSFSFEQLEENRPTLALPGLDILGDEILSVFQ